MPSEKAPAHKKNKPRAARDARRIIPPFVAVSLALAPSGVRAEDPRLIALGEPAGAFSSATVALNSDGTAAALQCSFASGGARPFRWTAGGGTHDLGLPLGWSEATSHAMSADGSVIVGWGGATGAGFAFRWNATTGYEHLFTPPIVDSSATGVSADGEVVVGAYIPAAGSPVRPFRWTRSGGALNLGTLPGATHTEARGVSASGAVVVGHCSPTPLRAFQWTYASGIQAMGALPGWAHVLPQDTSADGSVIVGLAYGSPGQRAFRWTTSSGFQDMGVIPGSAESSFSAVSDDGLVVVGTADLAAPTFFSRAILWTQATGLVNLNDYLPSLGIDLSGWTLNEATAISSDGTVIGGNGMHEFAPGQFRIEAYLAVIRGCSANCDHSTTAPILNINDFTCFLNKFAANDPTANCDASTAPPTLNVNDFTCFLNRYAAGCP